jgi:curved DNA-binding protein CbpA
MPSSARPDLFAFMDAYKVLGAEYSADSSVIRQGHKRLAKQHHPDKYPAGSAEQQQATARMAEINDAYRLIRKAPLRYHRVSKASDPTTPWTDTELDDAIRRARMDMDQEVDQWITIALIAVGLIILSIPAWTSMWTR